VLRSDTNDRRCLKSYHLIFKVVVSKCMNCVIFVIRDTIFVDLLPEVRREIGCHSVDVHLA
jgi:hypothetical protein